MAEEVTKEFMGDQPNPQETPTNVPALAQQTNTYEELLAAIVNAEGKPKYKSVPDGLIALAKAQEHIARLEAENADFRTKVTRTETADELLQRLGNQQRVDQPQAIKPENVETLVKQTIEKLRGQEIETKNRSTVIAELTKRYGEKTDEALMAKATSLGLSVQDLGALASRSPAAVLELFGSTRDAPTVRGTVNTQALHPARKEALPPKDIMLGADTADVMAYWRQLREETEEELGE